MRPPGVLFEVRGGRDYTVVVRGPTVVLSFGTPEGEHRVRLVGVGDPVPLLAREEATGHPPSNPPSGWDSFDGVRVKDTRAVDGNQREIGRFTVSVFIDDTYAGYWTSPVPADAVEYHAPGASLSRR